nr:hypothetical protein [Tanacetum cinerariifolium]
MLPTTRSNRSPTPLSITHRLASITPSTASPLFFPPFRPLQQPPPTTSKTTTTAATADITIKATTAPSPPSSLHHLSTTVTTNTTPPPPTPPQPPQQITPELGCLVLQSRVFVWGGQQQKGVLRLACTSR